MCRHDEDLVGPSFLQRLGCCHKTVNIIDDVILWDKQTGKSKISPSQTFCLLLLMGLEEQLMFPVALFTCYVFIQFLPLCMLDVGCIFTRD